MLVDIHCHATYTRGLSRPNGSRYPLPGELIEMLDAAGIDKAVVMSTVSPEVRYSLVTPQEVMRMCREHPDRLVPFCNIDPRMLTNSPKADFMPMLGYFKDVGFKGVGEYFPNLPFDDPLNMNVFKQVEEVGFSLTFHVATSVGGEYGCYDEPGLPRLEKVLKACPKLVLLGHSPAFWSQIDANVTDAERGGYPKGKVTPGRIVELMRNYPNLHGDLAAGSGLNAVSRDPDFGCRFMEEFQDRLYFGTDIANVPQKLPQVTYFEKLKAQKLISQEAHEKITWRNASRLLGLDAE